MRDYSIPIVVITAAVHLVRGAQVDGAIFLTVAAALAADQVADRLAADRVAEPAAERARVPGIPPRVLVASALAGLVLAAGGRFNPLATLAVAALGLVGLLASWRQPAQPVARSSAQPVARSSAQPPAPVDRPVLARPRVSWPWAAVGLAWCLVELWSFLHEVGREESRWEHPTFSAVVGPALEHRPLLWLAFTGWLAGGYLLLRIARAAVRR